MGGVYNGDPTLVQNSKHGVDWTMRGPLFAMGEAGFLLNQGPGATGLPGTYKVGGYYAAGDYPDLFFDVQGSAASVSGLPPWSTRAAMRASTFFLTRWSTGRVVRRAGAA